MKKIILGFFILLLTVTLTACSTKKEEKNNNNQQEEVEYTIVDKTKDIEGFVCAEALQQFYEDDNYRYSYSCIKSEYIVVKYKDGTEETVKDALVNGKITISDLDKFNISYYKEEKNNNPIGDDEIIDPEDFEEKKEEPETIESTLINCNDCVFAYYTEAKTWGDVLTEYTKDYNTIKDKKGKQRRRFMGHVIDSDGKILKAYVCGIKDGKAFCLEGATNDSTYEYNVGILKQVYPASECKYIANGKTYTCTDGNMNADTRADGNVTVHYDENCHVWGEQAKFYCYAHN